MRRFRAGQLTTIAVLTASFPLLLPSSAAVGGVAGAVIAEPAIAGRFAHVEVRNAAGPRIACGVVSAPGTGPFRHGWRSHAWT